jgi:type I restriction enzyme S subunit
MKLKTYPKYRDSGIQWIGEIPEGWEISRLKNKTLIKYGSSLSELDRQEGGIDVFGSNGIVGKHNRSITKGKTIIIGRKGSHGKVNLSEDSCFPIDTTYFIDKTCTRFNIKYLFYLLNQLKLDETSRDSAVPGLSRDITYNKIVPYISIKDQITIASFLDKQTAKIDALIKKDKKLIALLKEKRTALINHAVTKGLLLKEKRTALINHAVTKGLDPNVKLKDSWIEWIGEIPEGWKVIKLKFIADEMKEKERDGKSCSC